MPLVYVLVGIVMASYATGGRCELTEVFAEAGSDAVLPCKFDRRSSNSVSVSWTKKGTVWKMTQSGLQFWGQNWVHKAAQCVRCLQYQIARGDYSLQLSGVRQEDAGLFLCRVGNADRLVQHQVMLRIVEVSISPSFPLWGSQFSISCKVTPGAPGAAFEWTLNNSSAIEGVEISQTDATDSAVRGVASTSLEGTWNCVVGYKGQVGRASAALTPKGIDQPSKDNSRVYAALGSAATLPCVFSPGLSPTSSAWERVKPGFLSKPASSQLPASFALSGPSSQPGVDRSAVLKEVHLEDEGTYRCSGTVEALRVTRDLHLVVAKVEISLPAYKADSIMLTCQLTDTSEVTRYEWVHQEFDHSGNQSVTSTHTGKELTIDKRSGENQGEWTCRFYGTRGLLGSVTHHITAMSGLSGQKAGLTNKTAAAVGLSFLLAVLLLVLVQTYKNHRRRKMILQYPTLETIVHRISNEREERARRKEEK